MNGVPSPVGLPFSKAAVAGIEPASARLTAAHPYQHGTTASCLSVRTTGFEPAISCAQSRRNARLSHVLNHQSVQRELNPHLLHGKQVRYLYAMNAWLKAELSKIIRAPGGTLERLKVEGGRRKTESDSSFIPLISSFQSGIGGHRTHIVRFKRPVHYPVCHNPESVGAVGVEPTACAL